MAAAMPAAAYLCWPQQAYGTNATCVAEFAMNQ
jgi:hypothetical protein